VKLLTVITTSHTEKARQGKERKHRTGNWELETEEQTETETDTGQGVEYRFIIHAPSMNCIALHCIELNWIGFVHCLSDFV